MPTQKQRVATCLTPPGRSAIATIRVSGFDSFDEFDRFFRPASGQKLSAVGYGKIIFGHWKNLQGSAEELVVVPVHMEELQIHCHGGTAPVEAILESLESVDFEVVTQDSIRDSIHGDEASVDLASEIHQGLLHARSRKIADHFLNLQSGILEKRIQQIADEACFADQLPRLLELAESFKEGQFLTRPVRVVFAGSPNVGKSSLNNQVLGYSRSIVYDQPGTTRDVVAESTSIDGWLFEFSDTAGLRTADDQVEAAGVEFALSRLARADVVVRVVSAESGWPQLLNDLSVDSSNANEWGDWGVRKERTITVANKIDLLSASEVQELSSSFPQVIPTDARTGVGIERLMDCVKQQALPTDPQPGEILLFTVRQCGLVKRAIEAIKSGNENEARMKLRQILTGSCR